MSQIVFDFNVTLADYRRMLYFNTFSLRRLQSFLVVVIWAAAASLLAMEALGVIAPTRIMHLCFLIVTVAVPMLVVSIEIRVRRSRGEDTLKEQRTVFLDESGVRVTGGGMDATKAKWNDLQAVYDTKSSFIIYRDNRRIILLPKRGQDAQMLARAQELIKRRLSGRYQKR